MAEIQKTDETGQIDVNPSAIIERVDTWVDGFVKLLPNIGVAILLIIVGYIIARIVSSFVNNRFQKRDRHDLGLMMRGLTRYTIIFITVLVAATIIIPSLKIGEIIGGLGIGSVAIGFAFKDILQNWLAGFLILLRQPFEVGDQIEINGYEGTVETIQTRSTLIKTYDGQRVVIPNSDIYTNAVLVKTAYEKRRSQYDIGVGYGDDIEKARDIILETLKNTDSVETDPAPQAIPWDLAASWVTIRARWWTDTKRADVVAVRSDVIMSIKRALDEANIDMPYETQVHLFHDQTEESDGDRSSQREGWPDDSDGTTPRWLAKEKLSTESA